MTCILKTLCGCMRYDYEWDGIDPTIRVPLFPPPEPFARSDEYKSQSIKVRSFRRTHEFGHGNNPIFLEVSD
jgi:hypothetical protein